MNPPAAVPPQLAGGLRHGCRGRHHVVDDEEVARKLILRGHKQVFILSGGLKGWQKGGYPVAP